MKKITAEETLVYLIELFTCYLEDLQAADARNENDFMHGEKTAYVECLEIIQTWENAAVHGLHFNVEKRFPV